ncbi:MAG TPA: DUF1015 domain-containing protein [Phycisphaerales bacterium]|nr:DUF1015 domain-containing protein [Phycisphaerales bacterium]
MPDVFPFHAIHYPRPPDQSALIAPPYDVLDAPGKQRLLDKDPRNIVAIDLPHTPAKELGPPGAYAAAGERFRELLRDGTLTKASTPVMFAYRQTWMRTAANGEQQHLSRSGMACCVETVPFGARAGGGVLPHEETFSGPKADRLALMHATKAQLSPIFGLHADDRGAARGVLNTIMSARAPDRTATTHDGTLHEVWTIADDATINAYRAALAGEDIFVADGHHRYNTALNYLHELEVYGKVPADHAARRTMFVLVGMSDPGLVIWPTHRVLGGMADYTFEAFSAAAAGLLTIRPIATGPGALEQIERTINAAPASPNIFGLYDFATEQGYSATLTTADPLATSHASKPASWRTLDVAIIQHAIVEQICQPRLNRGAPVKWAFPHTIEEVRNIPRGTASAADESPDHGAASFAQLAIIVRPTPLAAVKDVSRAGELMPQKSTFFYPKLATGLFMHSLK